MQSPLTHHEQKDTIKNFAVHGRLIPLLFHSFEVASGPHPKDLTFATRMKPNLFNTLSVAPEVNAQRTKNEPSSFKIQWFYPFLNDTLKSA